MTAETSVLLLTAAILGFFHTLFGPDHYLPFILMSKSGEWSIRKTALITFFCGVGHVLGSVVLGAIGIALGAGVTKLIGIEKVRGEIAAWVLIAFGFVYAIWGLKQAGRSKSHQHVHAHHRGVAHSHIHNHQGEHAHPHGRTESITPWVLFTIFVLGPCEPLIPLLMYPAAQNSLGGLLVVVSMFGLITISTMLAIVLLSVRGLQILPMQKIGRYMHAIAGSTILASGLAIKFLGF